MLKDRSLEPRAVFSVTWSNAAHNPWVGRGVGEVVQIMCDSASCEPVFARHYVFIVIFFSGFNLTWTFYTVNGPFLSENACRSIFLGYSY